MDLDALPHAVLLVLAEFTVGSLIALLVADARGMVPAGYVKLSAGIVVIGAALMLISAATVDPDALQDYRLRDSLDGPVRAVSTAFLVLTLPYAWLAFAERRRPSIAAGGVAAAAGLGAIGLLAAYVSPPAWSLAGVLLSLVAGALALGFVSQSMILGHWYLVTPKLAARPLIELTFVLLAVLAVQAVLLVLNAAIPARDVPEVSGALTSALGSNPAFWLRVGVGMVFPIALVYMAWQSSVDNAMMSATGLLYIAVGAVFAGELLARGLLFVTAAPV